MAESANIQKMGMQHEQIMRLLIARPFMSLRELAIETGYTVPWLSVVINSDCFKSKMKEMQDGMNSGLVQDVGTQLKATLQVGMEQMRHLLNNEGNIQNVNSSVEMMLKMSGYGQQVQPQQQTHMHLHAAMPAAVLQKARESFGSPALVVEKKETDVPTITADEFARLESNKEG